MTSVVAELLGQYYVIPWIMWLGNMPVAFLVLPLPRGGLRRGHGGQPDSYGNEWDGCRVGLPDRALGV